MLHRKIYYGVVGELTEHIRGVCVHVWIFASDMMMMIQSCLLIFNIKFGLKRSECSTTHHYHAMGIFLWENGEEENENDEERLFSLFFFSNKYPYRILPSVWWCCRIFSLSRGYKEKKEEVSQFPQCIIICHSIIVVIIVLTASCSLHSHYYTLFLLERCCTPLGMENMGLRSKKEDTLRGEKYKVSLSSSSSPSYVTYLYPPPHMARAFLGKNIKYHRAWFAHPVNFTSGHNRA